MPIGVGTAIAIGSIGAAATATASIYGANKQASAADRAAQLTTQSSADQLAYLKEQAKIDQANYDKTAEEDKRRYEETLAENKREFESTSGLQRQRFEAGAPYRQLGASATNTMGALLAKHFGGSYSPASGTDGGSRVPNPVPTPGPVMNGPDPGPIVYNRAPTSTYGRMPTATMSDLMGGDGEPAPTDLARPGSMGEILSPFVYMRDASGRMIQVPRGMVPQGARV